MWTCVHCGLEVLIRATKAEVDDEGCYFICPACDGRNRLVKISGDGDEAIVLGQPDDK